MPRGYLKRRRETVGRKRGRGGSSKVSYHPYPRYWYRCGWCGSCGADNWSKCKCLWPITEEDIVDWYTEDDMYLESDEEIFEKDADDFDTETVHNQASSFQEESFVAVSDTSSYSSFAPISDAGSYSLCDDHESTFSLILETESLKNFNNKNEPDLHYLAVDVGNDLDSISCTTLEHKPQQRMAATKNDQASVCCLCFEEKPVVKVMKKCRHPSACLECLRQHYIIYAQESAANYPLQCFWPGCDRILRDVQVKKFAENESEMEKYYEKEAHAKVLRKHFKDVRVCPHCSWTNLVRPYCQRYVGKSYEVTCNHCSLPFPVQALPKQELMSVLAALGTNFANCPSCGAFITKDGGCDHMICVICKAHFTFQEAFREARFGK